MEVKSKVGLRKGLTNVLGHEHQVVPVHPNHFQVLDLRFDFDYFGSDLLINAHVALPVVVHKVAVDCYIKEIVHFRLD